MPEVVKSSLEVESVTPSSVAYGVGVNLQSRLYPEPFATLKS